MYGGGGDGDRGGGGRNGSGLTQTSMSRIPTGLPPQRSLLHSPPLPTRQLYDEPRLQSTLFMPLPMWMSLALYLLPNVGPLLL